MPLQFWSSETCTRQGSECRSRFRIWVVADCRCAKLLMSAVSQAWSNLDRLHFYRLGTWHMSLGKASSLPVPHPGPSIPPVRLYAMLKLHPCWTRRDNIGTSPSDIFVVRCHAGPAGDSAPQSSPERRCCNGSGFFRCPICDSMTSREQSSRKHFDCTC